MIRAWAIAACAILAGCNAPRPDRIARDAAADGYACWIADVVDGDTVRIRCSDGFRPSARLMGFDTPETHRPGCRAEAAHGARATALLRQSIARARIVDYTIHGRDRYNRMLMRLYLDGQDVADLMINAGLALPYDGGRRESWCDILRGT